MPRLSLTDFVDIVASSGTPKATKVRQVKERPEYEPAFDFYKQLREGIVACHSSAGDRSSLQASVGDVRDEKKVENYAAAIAGYRKWWGHKNLRWFAPPQSMFSHHGVDVSVNPELGLFVNEQASLCANVG